MDILLGLDIGTTKLCAVAVQAESRQLLAVEDALNEAQLPAEPDAAEQDARVILAQALALLARLLARPELAGARPLALGVTGQMHGVVLVDAAGTPLSPLITWQDGRGNRPAATGRTYAAELAQRLGDGALADTGCTPASGYGAVTLLRLREEDLLPAGARALTIHDLLVRTLCGRALTDPTDAASWGIFDVRHGARWLPGASAALELPADIFPEIAPTGSVAGGLLPHVAAIIGAPTGLPVAVAIGDNQASFLASVPARAETVLLNLGTGGQMSVPVDRYTSAPGLDTRPLLPGLWLLVGASLCGGRAYQVLERFFAAVGRELFGSDSAEALYEAMNRLAAQANEDCGGLTASTRFAGTRLDPAARGELHDIDIANLTPGNLTRAVIAGMVEELAEFYALAQHAGAHPTHLAASGNAVRRNPLVRQTIERRFNLPLHLPSFQEEAAVGAALVGGMVMDRGRDVCSG